MPPDLVKQPPVADAQQLRRPFAVPPRLAQRATDGLHLRLVAEKSQRKIPCLRKLRPRFHDRLRRLGGLHAVRFACHLRLDFIHIHRIATLKTWVVKQRLHG